MNMPFCRPANSNGHIRIMTRRAGSADLPSPRRQRSAVAGPNRTTLGLVQSCREAIIHHYGRDELLRRLAQIPSGFSRSVPSGALDLHSSGITTSVIGALKRGLTPHSHELGIHVCGGRGKHSRQTPQELIAIGDRVGVFCMAILLRRRAAWSRKLTARQCRMASTFICTDSSSLTTATGLSFSRA